MIGVVVRSDGLLLDEGLPMPVEADGEVIVKMEAACVAPLDVQIAAGWFPMRPPVPYVAGLDGAGRVVSRAGALEGKRVRIRGAGVGMTRDGCAAERVALPAAALHELREDVDAGTAATFFVPCSTAYAALYHVGGVQLSGRAGARRGAAGSVGQVAVQLALAAGASEVIGIVSAEGRTEAVPEGARAVVAGSPEELRDRLQGGRPRPSRRHDRRPRVGRLHPGDAAGRIVLVGYAGGVRLELDVTELIARDVSLLPLNGIGREAETAPRSGEWLDAIVRGDLYLATSVFPVERLADAVAAVCGSPSPGRVAVLFR